MYHKLQLFEHKLPKFLDLNFLLEFGHSCVLMDPKGPSNHMRWRVHQTTWDFWVHQNTWGFWRGGTLVGPSKHMRFLGPSKHMRFWEGNNLIWVHQITWAFWVHQNTWGFWVLQNTWGFRKANATMGPTKQKEKRKKSLSTQFEGQQMGVQGNAPARFSEYWCWIRLGFVSLGKVRLS